MYGLREPAKKHYNAIEFPATVTVDGQQVAVTEELVRRFAQLYKLKHKKYWYSFSRRFKSLDTPDAPFDVYEVWDSICRRADGYDEDNNRRMWAEMAYEPDGFQKLVNFVGRRLIEEPGVQAIERRFRRVMESAPEATTTVGGVRPHVVFRKKHVARYAPNGGIFSGDERIVMLRSAMGTGKTEALRAYIETLPAETSILMLSPKVALANAFHTSYADMGFELYNDPALKGKQLTAKRLICQVESICRIDIKKTGPFDILVLDESELITAQLTSGLGRDANGSYTVLNFIMRNSGRLICCDALMGEWTFGLPGAYGYTRADTKIYLNTYQNDTDVDTICCREEAEVIRQLIGDIAGPVGKNAVVACAHRRDADAIAALCAVEVGADKVLVITGKSTDEIKATAGRCNDEWVKYRVVIYTNTIECGVSFTKEHFHRFYGLFDNETGPSHKSYMQMIKRVRGLRDNKRFIHIGDAPLTLAVHIKLLEMQIQLPYFADKLGLAHSVLLHDLSLLKTYVYPFKKGNPVYKLALLNLLANHRSRRNFTANLLNSLRETGTRISMTPDPRSEEERAAEQPSKAFATTTELLNKARKLAKEKGWENVHGAELGLLADIERVVGEDGSVIINATPEQQLAMAKKEILNLIEIQEEDLTVEDVAFFHEKPDHKRAWRNLKDLVRSKDKESYLKAKRKEPDRKILGKEYHQREIVSEDVLKSVLTARPAWRIEAALEIIKLCGWSLGSFRRAVMASNDDLWEMCATADQVRTALHGEYMQKEVLVIQLFSPPDRAERLLKPEDVPQASMRKLLPLANFCLAELSLCLRATDKNCRYYVLQKLIDHKIAKVDPRTDPIDIALSSADREEFANLNEQVQEELYDDLDD